MPSVSATAAQYGAGQVQLQQAKRIAAQAEQTANALQAAARNARLDAENAANRARNLESRSDSAATVAARARQGVVAVGTRDAAFERLQTTLDSVVTQLGVAPAKSGAEPVVNSLGETTGQIVNTTA